MAATQTTQPRWLGNYFPSMNPALHWPLDRGRSRYRHERVEVERFLNWVMYYPERHFLVHEPRNDDCLRNTSGEELKPLYGRGLCPAPNPHPTPTPPRQPLLYRNVPHCPCRIRSLQQAQLRPPDWQLCLKAFSHWFGVDRQDHSSHWRGACDMLGQGEAAKAEVSAFPMWLLGNGSPFVCTNDCMCSLLVNLRKGESGVPCLFCWL